MASMPSIVPDNSTSMKNNSDCDFCSLEDCFIGINDLKIPVSGGASYEPKKKKKKTNKLSKNDNDNILIMCHTQPGSKVQFKMGNGKFTEDIEEAKDHLMKRNYPEIENGTQNGPIFIPETSLPEKYYRGVDPENFPKKVKQLHDTTGKEEFTKLKSAKEEMSVFEGEHAERIFFDEIHRVLDSKSVVLNGVKLPQLSEPNQDQESDFLVIDSERKFIFSLEIKSNLFSEAKGKIKITSVKKGVEQISKIKKILEKYFCTNIDLTGWKFVGALGYGSKADHVQCCLQCKPFIVDTSGVEALFNKLDKELIGSTSGNHEAFKMLIRNLIFCIFANPGPVMRHNYDEETCLKIKQQGKWQNVLFWTPKQFELIQLDTQNSPLFKHVIFDSSYSTGKTEVMKAMMRKLLDKSQKIHFIFSDRFLGRHPKNDEILLSS